MTQPTVDQTTQTGAELTALDRCDACGAQAYVRVHMATGGELLFCAHHARKHEAKLNDVAVAWHDETERLREAVRPSA